jgi:hypothetical protein
VIASCGHRRDPATLAVTPDPHAAGTHCRLPGDYRNGGPCVTREHGEGGTLPATRGAFPAPVIDERRDTKRRKERRQMPVQGSVAGAAARRMDRHDNGEPGRPRPHRQRAGKTSSVTVRELDLAWNKLLRAPFSHLPAADCTPGLHRLGRG